MNQPSIFRIPTEEPSLFAFEVRGKIRKGDLRLMAETVEQGFNMFERIDILILMTRYDGIELGAAFDPEGLSAQAQSVRHVRRYAVVGAPRWVETMITIGDSLSPVDARTFDLAEAEEAWAWVRAA